jgi:nucleoside-diphosphate kinase
MKFITSGPVVVTVVEAVRATEVVRKLMGETFGFNAQPGTVRGDFAISKGMNVVHGSDSAASASREIPIFFGASELATYEMPDQRWIADEKEDAG